MASARSRRCSNASDISSTLSFISGRGRGLPPRTRFVDCPLLRQLLEDFHIDPYLIQSRYAATDRRSRANYKCPVCQNVWGSQYGWFTIDIKAPAVRHWGQCCQFCHRAENQYYLSEATLQKGKCIIERYHRPLRSEFLEDRFQYVRTYEQKLARAARDNRAEQGDYAEERSRERHNAGLCERCKYGRSPYCLTAPRNDG